MPNVMIFRDKYYLLTIISCCLMAAASVGMFTNAYGVLYAPLIEKLGAGRGTVALHATIAGLITALLGPLVVKLLPKVRMQALIFLGILLMAGSVLLTGAVTAVWQLNLIGVMRGIGCACYYIPVITVIVGNWFKHLYGTISGIVFSFSGISGAVFSLLLTYILQRHGLNGMLGIAAVLIILCSLPGLLFCKLSPEERGMHAFGADGEMQQGAVEHSENSTAGSGKLESAIKQNSGKKHNRWMLLLLSTIGFMTMAVTGLLQHMSGYAESIGLDAAVGVKMMSLVMIGNIISKLINGMLSDLIGEFNTAILFLGIVLMCLVVFFTSSGTVWVLYIASFLFGSMYAFGSVGLATVSKKVFDNEQHGNAFAIINGASAVGAALSLTAIGASYDLTQSYALAIIVSIAFVVVSMTVLCFLNRRKKVGI